MDKCFKCKIFIMLLSISTIGLSQMLNVFGWQGDIGYEGGISTGQQPSKTTAEYKEVLFLTGQPIEVSGTLLMKKSLKKDTVANKDMVSTVYSYTLTNAAKAVSVTRVITLQTGLDKKDNGQIIENTEILGIPIEIIKIKDIVYTLKTMELTRTCLVDPRPSIEYYSGNLMWKKTYKTGQSAGAQTETLGSITVEASGIISGYNQYWGSVETVKYDMNVSSESKVNEKIDKWGGTASVKVSHIRQSSIRYQENEPTAISFEGGYIQDQKNKSNLEYVSKLPEFDSLGVSTYNILENKGMLTLETFPVSSWLKVANIQKIKGHWAHKDIEQLLGFEVFKYEMNQFDPEEYMSRGEFIDALVKAAKDVPKDPVFNTAISAKQTPAPTAAASKTGIKARIPIFKDMVATSPFIDNVEEAYKRKMISGRSDGTFGTNDYLMFGDAITALIRTIGLENVSKWPGNVTYFKDNNEILPYARDSIIAASKIGLIKGDGNGMVRPNQIITKARTAVILNKFINFMRENMVKEYTEKLINY